MAIPDYQTFMRPLLEYGADEQEKNIREAIAFLSDQFELSPEDRLQTIPSGKEPLVSNRREPEDPTSKPLKEGWTY